jgi:predicted peroxiredoxin
MAKVKKVLLLLKSMIYESTSPQEILRFAMHYRKKGLEVVVVLFGPMGVIMSKSGKQQGLPDYDFKIKECLDMGIKFRCCKLGASVIGLEESELIHGIEMIDSKEIADMFIEYCEEGQLIITL